MTQTYRTTKIPDFYFKQIEEYLLKKSEFVSVSEFIRDSIKEKLFRLSNETVSQKLFLISKDIVFNEEKLTQIHDSLIENGEIGKLKDIPLQSIVNRSLNMDYLKFLSNFLLNFALVHPFNDGNKRTSWIAVDVFLRLNNKKLKLAAKENAETKDELFIWQNSTNQKSKENIVSFLKSHIIDYYESSEDFETELDRSLKENKTMLLKLSK
jgi:prophage maintenance system killer protein